MDTAIELQFADGKYLFGLKWPQIIELERKCGSVASDGTRRAKSIFQIYDELGEMAGVATDLREVVRLSLIGGNHGVVNGEAIEVGPITAANLCDEYLFPVRPLNELMQLAAAILTAAISGVDVKKKDESEAGAAVTVDATSGQNLSEKEQ